MHIAGCKDHSLRLSNYQEANAAQANQGHLNVQGKVTDS